MIIINVLNKEHKIDPPTCTFYYHEYSNRHDVGELILFKINS